MTFFELSREVYRFFYKRGIHDAEFESKQLVKNFCTNVFDVVDDKTKNKIYKLSKKRAKGYPLQYILKKWEFYSIPFLCEKGVLIPRPDTEKLVDVALSFLAEKKTPQVLDLCSGSGCVAIAIAKNCIESKVTALEKSKQAYSCLCKNIELNTVKNIVAVRADVFASPFGKFDLIVSNPPYIKRGDIKNLSKEVRHEPIMALDGGKDGLTFYRRIIGNWKTSLKEGGVLVVEIGYDQAQEVRHFFEKENFQKIETYKDLNGITRVIKGTAPKNN